MQVTVENNSSLERTVKIEVPEDKIASAVEDRLKSLSRTTRVQGFRPGKVPFKIIRQRYGEQVRQEVVGKVLQSSLSEAITQENLRPAGSPEIHTLDAEQGKGLSYTARFEVLPEVKLQPVEDLQIEKASCEITDTDVDKMVGVLRSQHTREQDVDRESTIADVVHIGFRGLIDGEPFEGGESTDMRLDLSEKRLIDGFEDGLLGRKAGAEFSLDLVFPDSYHVAALAGKPVVFEIKLNRVCEKVLPEMDDEFFKAFGIEEGGEDAFRKQVREHMEKESRQTLHRKLRESVMSALRKANEIELPQVLVHQEIHRIRHQFEDNLKSRGLKTEEIDKHTDDKMFEEQARNRVSLQLILAELIREQDLKADPAKVRETIMQFAQNYEDPTAILNWYYGDKERLAEIEAMTLENTVIDWVAEKARKNEVSVTFDECMNNGQTESA